MSSPSHPQGPPEFVRPAGQEPLAPGRPPAPAPAPSPWSTPTTATRVGPPAVPPPAARPLPGAGPGPAATGPGPGPFRPEQFRPERKRRGGLAAVLVAAAVLAGGAAGAGVTALSDGGTGSAALPRVGAAARPAGSLAEVAERVLPSVVSVRVSGSQGSGTGSGFVLDGDGHVLTNAHVVSGASRVTVVDSTGRSRTAEVVGVDGSTDLAVLRTSGGLTPVALGTSADLAVGDPVLAVGSPLGLSGTVTAGIVSATDREVEFGDGRGATAIQTDASINPGNSGGPLVDASGRVVGVNTQIATLGRASGNIGIGFAIPVDRAATVAETLIAGG